MDINEEYERLFGSARKVDLFDPEEDYYNVLRQEIISAERQQTPKRRQQFSGIQLIPYSLYALEQAEKKAIEEGKHLFYFRIATYDSPDYCSAIGYFIPTLKKFVILPYSHISTLGAISCTKKDDRLKRERGHWYLMKTESFPSAEKAAHFVYGKDIEEDVWMDREGKKFSECFPTFTDSKPSQNDSPTIAKTHKHLFYLEDMSNNVKAVGYYEPETNYFYIQKGSLVSSRINSILLDDATIAARNRFISEACKSDNGACRVIKDAKCRSASAAATYTLGRKVNGWLAWKDIEGQTLKDFYKR